MGITEAKPCPASRAFIVVALVLSFWCPCARLESYPQRDVLEGIQQLIRKGELAKARTQLLRVLKGSPRNPAALDLLGVVAAQAGEYRTAEESFQKAIAAAPRFAVPYLNLGRLYQMNVAKDSDALKKSVVVYDKLLEIEPTNSEAVYQCAFLLTKLGSYDRSLARLSQLPLEACDRPQALAVRYVDHAGLGHLGQAEATADRLLKHPDLVEADVLSILPMLFAQHHDDLVLKLLEGLAYRHLATPDTLHQLAALYERRADMDRARTILERIAQQQGISVPLLMELGHVADRQGDREGALGYLAHARDLEPNNAAIHFFFGMVCVEMNLAEEAYRSLKRAVSLNPENAYYNYVLGAIIMNRDEVREAYPYFKKYCEKKPGDPRGHLALGAAYFYGHDAESARKELEGAAKHGETAAGAHYFLGRLANQEGKYAEAGEEIRKALEGNPRYADAYAELGLLYLKQKEYKESENALRNALAIDADSYTANLNLMMLYQRTKDPRADSQAKRFDEVRIMRAERQAEFLRTIEVRP